MLVSLDGIKGEVCHKTVAMEAEMLKLAQRNQSLANALLKLTELMGLLQVKKEENPFRSGSLRIEKSTLQQSISRIKTGNRK